MTGALIPRPEFYDAKALVIIDNDGVLNRLGRNTKSADGAYIIDDDNEEWWIDPNLDVIAELDNVLHRHHIVPAWLTTWGRSMRHIIDGPLNGLLAGGFVLATKPPLYSGDWKVRALLDRVNEYRVPYAWLEDADISRAMMLWPAFADGTAGGTNRLLLNTDDSTGITAEQVHQLDTWLSSL